MPPPTRAGSAAHARMTAARPGPMRGTTQTDARSGEVSTLAGRRVAVVGLQRSNAAVVRYLRRQGAQVEAYDRKVSEELGPYAADLPPGAPLFAGPDYLERLHERLDGLAAIFVTPGMRKDLPVLAAGAAAGAELWTEAAYVLQIAACPVVGITGSAGKTTTTTLVGEAVRRWRPGSLVGGNIGVPLIDRLDEVPPGAWLVMELSSFQLELARRAPNVAALLNVRENHLDVHGSYAAYVDAKRNIYRRQVTGDWAVFGVDDPEAAALGREAPAGRLCFSGKGPVEVGVGVEDGLLRWYPPHAWRVHSEGGGSGGPHPYPRAARLLPVRRMPVPGAHNLQNAAAAAAVAMAAGVPPAIVAGTIASFRGVEHRLEVVREWRGARFVNDSIATTPDRTLAALETFAGSPVVLLAGGYDKGIPFDELGARLAQAAERVILFGSTADLLARAVAAGAGGGTPRVERVRDLAAAVAAALDGLQPGAVVLLSPACASYDQFRDFEERGRCFKALVASLPE